MTKNWVTTKDNPYDFFTQFDEWNEFDTEKGYNTCSYVARLVDTYEGMSENEVSEEINRVIDDIVRLNLTGNYIKISEND